MFSVDGVAGAGRSSGDLPTRRGESSTRQASTILNSAFYSLPRLLLDLHVLDLEVAQRGDQAEEAFGVAFATGLRRFAS